MKRHSGIDAKGSGWQVTMYEESKHKKYKREEVVEEEVARERLTKRDEVPRRVVKD